VASDGRRGGWLVAQGKRAGGKSATGGRSTPRLAPGLDFGANNELFPDHRDRDDVVGMEVARKLPQLGFVSRARRYANHASGQDWSPDRTRVRPPAGDSVKAELARIFCERHRRVRDDPAHRRARAEQPARTAIANERRRSARPARAGTGS
jgi:hypothetical protein